MLHLRSGNDQPPRKTIVYLRVSSQAQKPDLENQRRALDRSGRRKGTKVGFPAFKSRRRGYGSFYVANDRLTVDGHTLTVQKVGALNMTDRSRPFDACVGVPQPQMSPLA